MTAADAEAWRAAGSTIDTPDGPVWMRVVPATTPTAGHDPLLVLHGFPSSSFDWRHVLPAFAATHDVVLFDFLGFGSSGKPDRRYSIELHANTTEIVAAHAGVERVILVSHDMGNSIGGEVLARDLADELDFTIARRLLTNGSIYIEMAQLTAGQQLLLSLPDEPFDLGDDVEATFCGGVAATFSAAHPATDDELAAHWALMSRDRGDRLLTRTIRYIEDRRAREARYTGAIERHPSPLHVVWGRDDPVAVHPMTERLLAARPDATLATLDGVAHWPMIEDPEGFAAAAQSGLSSDSMS
jgi:pimeloyl-ACP methyl ester carboxylesterase